MKKNTIHLTFVLFSLGLLMKELIFKALLWIGHATVFYIAP